MPTLRGIRRCQNDFGEELRRKGWYHSFEGVDGVMPLNWLRERWERFRLPEDLSGKRLLDIGAWDGWFSFEAERRGASVVSVDREEIANYLTMHRRLGSRAEYRNLEFYEIPAAGLGQFDIVFCLGVLYHVRHPLLALEILCGLTTDVAIVETFIVPGEPEIPVAEFYELDELNGNQDNWWGPTANCVLAMCRAAGFARVETLALDEMNVSVACYRKWLPQPAAPEVAPPELLAAVNTATYGINFSSTRDEFVACWFQTAVAEIARENLCLEIGGFGAPAVFLRHCEDGAWHANFRLPPGTPPGWNEVRLRLTNSRFGNSRRIAVDLPVTVEMLVVNGVRDGATWEINRAGDNLSCWVEGLPENAGMGDVRLWIGDCRLRVLWVEDAESGARQINAGVPSDCPSGDFRVECAGLFSAPVPVKRQTSV